MRFLILLITFICLSAQYSFAGINYSVTPIKYELELQPGESITLPVSIRNNSGNTVTLPTATSDFQANGTGWVPSIVRKSELVYPDQELSTWITLWAPSVTMAPWKEESINFTIDVPTTATPGGHYWAVLFTNAWWESTVTWDIGITVDYGIIILVNVSWEIMVAVEIEDPIISWRWNIFYDICEWSDTSGSIYDGSCGEWVVSTIQQEDSCMLWDFTPSKYDNTCFGAVDTSDLIDSGVPSWNWTNTWEFNIDFSFPINNIGNTHVKPTGKIVLRDEDRNIIKAIWKETISNDQWAIIWENIVDYIPINDQGWNILPYSKRVFESEWKWFPYKKYDQQGNQVINYWSPSQYYTTKNKEDAWFLMLWERVSESKKDKIITAEIELIYYDEDWSPVEFTSAQEFPVQYIEQEVTINPYVILSFLLLLTSGVFWWFGVTCLLALKMSKCWNCKKKNKSHWGTCPHCSAIQDKKKHKAYEKQKDIDKKASTTIEIVTKKAPVKTTTAKKISTKKPIIKK